MKMNYQKPAVEQVTFQEEENVMVSATSFGLTDDVWNLEL